MDVFFIHKYINWEVINLENTNWLIINSIQPVKPNESKISSLFNLRVFYSFYFLNQ